MGRPVRQQCTGAILPRPGRGRELRRRRGCIVNMVDIHAERPNADHPIYCMAKAANAMMVKALARDLAPGFGSMAPRCGVVARRLYG